MALKPNQRKYYISYTTGNGKRKTEYFSKLPKGIHYSSSYHGAKWKGLAWITRYAKGGTSLIPLKVYKTKKQYRRK